MMPIKDITDQAALEAFTNKPIAKVYKGTPKRFKGDKASAGYDLNHLFRLETFDQDAARSLKKAYDKNKEQNWRYAKSLPRNGWEVKYSSDSHTILTDRLNIYLPFSDLYKIYDSKYARYSRKTDKISGLIHECDGEVIYRKVEPYQAQDGVRKRIVQCSEPCHKKSDDKCPLGCQASAILTFYICELYHLGIYDVCTLNAASGEDMRSLYGFLHNTLYKDRNTYNRAEHSLETGRLIPFVLYRKKVKINRPILDDSYKRTGKSTEDYTWAVSMKINPAWLEWEQKFFKVQNALSAGYSPDNSMLSAAYQVDLLPQGSMKQLPGWVATEADKIRARDLYMQNGWTKEASELMLKEQFQIDSFDKVYSMTEAGFGLLLDALGNKDLANKFINQTTEF